ncbi:hypothetical protein ACLKA7_002051 [Drosophila subpalustris]
MRNCPIEVTEVQSRIVTNHALHLANGLKRLFPCSISISISLLLAPTATVPPLPLFHSFTLQPVGILNPFAIWLCESRTKIYGKFLGFWVSHILDMPGRIICGTFPAGGSPQMVGCPGGVR